MHSNKEELFKDLIKQMANDEPKPDILAKPLWDEMIDDICKALKCKKEEFVMNTNTAVSLPNKNDDEATKIAMGYRWYVFEGSAEGDHADMALLSEEEYEVIKKFFKNKISFYDEGYSGDYYPLKSLGAFESKEEAVNGYMNVHYYSDSDDLVGGFKDMYKEVENER